LDLATQSFIESLADFSAALAIPNLLALSFSAYCNLIEQDHRAGKRRMRLYDDFS
jgi:hypothetical protein